MTTNLPMNKEMIKQWLHLLWMLPVVWLVGCSTDKGANPVDNTGARPIVFSVSTDAAPEEDTRGYLLNELDAEFGLFCAKYDYDDEWGDEGQALNFMYNEMVIGGGASWTTAEGYFVPKTDNLKFFAYYPYFVDVNDGTSPLTMFGNSSTVRPAPSFTYIMPDDAEEQQDLMYAISDEVHADPVTHQLGVVHLHFRHLLTGISFSAKSNETCTLKRITLTNLYKKGEFEFKDGAELRADDTYDYGDGFGNVYVDLNMKLKSSFKTADADKSFLLILQPKNDGGDVIINQEAKMIVELEAGGKTFTFYKSLVDLSESLGNCKNTLLRLSVESLQRIKVSATIVNWGHGATFDGAVSDQPTLELEPLILDWDDKDADNNDLVTDVITGPQDTNP